MYFMILTKQHLNQNSDLIQKEDITKYHAAQIIKFLKPQYKRKCYDTDLIIFIQNHRIRVIKSPYKEYYNNHLMTLDFFKKTFNINILDTINSVGKRFWIEE